MNAPATTKCREHRFYQLNGQRVVEYLGNNAALSYEEYKLVCHDCGVDSFLRSTLPVVVRRQNGTQD